MQKARATYSLDRSLLRATRIAAARQGKRESEVVEDALRTTSASASWRRSGQPIPATWTASRRSSSLSPSSTPPAAAGDPRRLRRQRPRSSHSVRPEPPADSLRAHAEGRFELILSERLLAEVATVLARDKLRRYLLPDQAERFVTALRRDALLGDDPTDPPPHPSPDPDDDYLLVLAHAHDAHVLVTGDKHLLVLQPPGLRIVSPRDFLTLLPA